LLQRTQQKRVTCTLQDISRRFSILRCKSMLGERRLSGTGCLNLRASNFSCLHGDTRLLRAGAEVSGKRQQHTAISGKPRLPRSIPGASFSHAYPDPSREFWSQWGLMVKWFKVAQSEPALCHPVCSCPLSDSSGTEQVNGKRCSGLPALHPSRVVCWLLQANGPPEILEAVQQPAQRNPFSTMATGAGSLGPSSGPVTLG